MFLGRLLNITQLNARTVFIVKSNIGTQLKAGASDFHSIRVEPFACFQSGALIVCKPVNESIDKHANLCHVRNIGLEIVSKSKCPCFAISFQFSRGFPGLVDNGNIWPRITTDEAFAETRKRIVESPQRGNNWRPRPSKSNSPALIAATALVITS
jgi:hypothetical protein